MQIQGRKISPIVAGLVLLGLIAGGSAIWNWYHPKQAITKQPVVAQEAIKAADIPKTTVAGPKTLVAYNREKIIKAMKPPAEIAEDKRNQFTTSANIPPSPYGGSALSFTNISTGKSGIIYQAKATPFFELKNVRELAVDYGITSKGKQEGVVGARWTFLRTGIVNWHGKAEVSTSPEAKVFVGVHAEF